MGKFLFEETIGQLPLKIQNSLQKIENLEIVIVSQDNSIRNLPWNLMIRNNISRIGNDWNIKISKIRPSKVVNFPNDPRILVLVPEPFQTNKTDSAKHLEEIEDLFFRFSENSKKN